MSEISTLISIGLVQVVAVISPGPSFLITARTAVARSRFDGVKVALGLGAGTLIWVTATLLGLNIVFRAVPILFLGMKIIGALFLVWIALADISPCQDPIAMDASDGEAVPTRS